MLSLALVISLGGLARASYDSISDWMRIALNPDLFVTTAESVTARSFVFPASLGDGLRAIDGVGEVQLVRSVRVLVKKYADHAGGGRYRHRWRGTPSCRRWRAIRTRCTAQPPKGKA